MNEFSINLSLEHINLNNNKIKYSGSGVFDQLKKLNKVYLRSNICVNKDFSDINQLKEDIKLECNNPNDLIEIITNLQQENKESNAQQEHKEALTVAEELQQKNNQTIIELIRERDAALKELLDAKEKQHLAQTTCESLDIELNKKLSFCETKIQ